MNSDEVGTLPKQSRIGVMERRLNSHGTIRVRFEGGWTSEELQDGSVVMELVGRGTTAPELQPAPDGVTIDDDSLLSERDALMLIYRKCDGEGWRRTAHFGSDTPIARWRVGGGIWNIATGVWNTVTCVLPCLDSCCEIPEMGVMETNEGRVSDLLLWNNRLTGELPGRAFASLPALVELKLQNNALTGRVPREIATCTSLVALILTSNQLTGELPRELALLVNLERLFLNNNEFKGTLPDLSRMKRLQWLRLGNSGLRLPPGAPISMSPTKENERKREDTTRYFFELCARSGYWGSPRRRSTKDSEGP